MSIGTSVTNCRLGWSLTELAPAIGLSRAFLRKEVRRGVLPAKKFGRRIIVLDKDLQRYLTSRPVRESQRGGLRPQKIDT